LIKTLDVARNGLLGITSIWPQGFLKDLFFKTMKSTEKMNSPTLMIMPSISPLGILTDHLPIKG